MVPRPLAHPPARLGAGVIAASTLLVLLLASGAEALDVVVAPYREAAQAGAVGTVTGRVYAESRTPSGPVRPLAAVTVTLLPRSPALLASFEQLKEDARRSAKAFAAAAPAMRRVQESYERELVQAGVPDLAPRIAVTPEGAFRLAEVPLPAGSPLAGASLRQAHIRDSTGALVLALRGDDGTFTTNPVPETVLSAGQILIAIGTEAQLKALTAAARPGS